MNTRFATHELAVPAAPSVTARAVHALTTTSGGITSTLLRLTLGLVMFAHGAQKMLGWFGGAGFDGTMSAMTEYMGLSPVIAALVILIEFFGSLALLLGLFSRAAALGIIAVMIGAITTVHLPNGFFMNWSGSQAGEGYEYHLLAIGLALAILLKGSGALSLDRALFRRDRAARAR